MEFNENDTLVEISFEDNFLIHPVYLRENTVDFAVFQQMMEFELYSFDFNFEPKVIVDCGAHIGLAAIHFKNRFPNAKIICIEPEANNYDMLIKNVEKYDDIVCYNTGVWNKSAYLSIEDVGSGNWGFIVKEVDKDTPNSIKALSIADIMKEHQIDCIDILKMNIEGAEKEVFESNYESWIPKTRTIILELHDRIKEGCSKSVFKTLSEYDFSTTIRGNIIAVSLNHPKA